MIQKRNKSYLFFYLPLFLFVAVLISGLKDSLAPLVFSYFLAYLSFPAMIRLEKKGLPRSASAILSFLLIVTVFVLLGIWLIPLVWKELTHILQNLPALYEKLLYSSWVPDSFRSTLSTLDPVEKLKSISLEEWRDLFPKIRNSVQGGMGVVQEALGLLIIPVFYFYVLLEYEDLKKSFALWIPKKSKPTVSKYFSEVREIWNAFFRGQFTVALCLGFIYGLGLWISQIPYGLGVGVLSGIFSLIPYVGFAVGLTTSLIIFAVSDLSLIHLVGILLTFGIGQFVESFILTPKLVGEKLGLNALWSIVALLVGGNLLGFFGLLFAIPLASAIKLFFQYWLRAHQQHCDETPLL